MPLSLNPGSRRLRIVVKNRKTFLQLLVAVGVLLACAKPSVAAEPATVVILVDSGWSVVDPKDGGRLVNKGGGKWVYTSRPIAAGQTREVTLKVTNGKVTTQPLFKLMAGQVVTEDLRK